MTAKNYRELIVWQRAMEVVEMVYTLTKAFPNDERFGLTSQVRRAAVSIPSNIAEGQARDSTAEFLRFLSIAQGSRAEVETQLLITSQLGCANPESIEPLLEKLEEVKRMTYSLEAEQSAQHSFQRSGDWTTKTTHSRSFSCHSCISWSRLPSAHWLLRMNADGSEPRNTRNTRST